VGLLVGLYSQVLFPLGYDCFVRCTHIEKKRSELIPTARGRVLEIGIGTGLNLPYYDKAVSDVTGIDPNPGMLRQLGKKLDRGRLRADVVRAGGERLPFVSESFDTIVSTHTLCSIPRLPDALREVRRVLKPDGRFLFFEHGLSPDEKVARWQNRLNRVQQIWAVGCRLNVPMKAEIEAAGFHFQELRQYYIEGNPKPVGFMYEGVAVKP